MRLFGRSKKEEEYEDEPRRRVLPKRELTEKEKFFKETKPRKNKHEIKPWGRKERLIVLGVLFSTVLMSAILAMSSREWKVPNAPRFKFPELFPSETITYEGKGQDVVKSKITKEFNRITSPLSGVYGFFVLDLPGNSFFGENFEETFEAASLNKLPVMLTMYKEAEKGTLNLQTKYILRDSDKLAGSGSLAGKPAGTAVTYEELVRLMGNESDNTAFNISKKILGDEKILAVMKDINMPTSLFTDDETTPEDIGYFFRTLYNNDYVTEETKDTLLGYMTNTIYENWIAKGIPVRVAHKFGTLIHVRNDAGIVYAQKPYILVVMSKGIVEKDADEVIPQLSNYIYQTMSN